MDSVKTVLNLDVRSKVTNRPREGVRRLTKIYLSKDFP